MTTVAEFSLPVDEFPLGVAIQEDHHLRIELERVIPVDQGTLPFFWAWDSGDFDTLEKQLRESPVVESIRKVDSVGSGRLYRATWNHTAEDFIRGITLADATIVEATGTIDGWTFELRFPDQESIQTFRRYAVEHEVPLQVERLHSLAEMQAGEQYDLTQQQRDLLVTAFEMGYFNDPQETTQKEIAEQLGISQRAVSGRVRRGLRRLLASTIANQ